MQILSKHTFGCMKGGSETSKKLKLKKQINFQEGKSVNRE
jgi:hypothetical protein